MIYSWYVFGALCILIAVVARFIIGMISSMKKNIELDQRYESIINQKRYKVKGRYDA